MDDRRVEDALRDPLLDEEPDDLDRYIEEQLRDPEFAAEYRRVVEARQRELVANIAAAYDPWGAEYRPGISDEMKQIRGAGPFYYVVHRQRTKHRVTFAHMREVDYPYRWGGGIEVHLFGRTIGFGLCRRHHFDHEYDGIREAVNGRDLPDTPEDIDTYYQ